MYTQIVYYKNKCLSPTILSLLDLVNEYFWKTYMLPFSWFYLRAYDKEKAIPLSKLNI
jgi:hypothetical protein